MPLSHYPGTMQKGQSKLSMFEFSGILNARLTNKKVRNVFVLPQEVDWRRRWHPTPVLLPGESQGPGSLVGCRLWGRTESDTTEAT